MRQPAKRKRHLLATLALALALAPGTFVRSTIPDDYSIVVAIVPLAFDARERDGLAVTGLWHLDGQGEGFGGYSAMLLIGEEAVRLFSDKGFLLTLPRPVVRAASRQMETRQLSPAGVPTHDLLDIESITLSPETGQYWVGYESRHTIYRFGADDSPEAFVEPAFARRWRANGGIEALVRLRDGRFLAFHEDGPDLFVYPDDPAAGAEAVRSAVAWPGGFHPTDAAELPDGRVLVLLRKVGWNVPPFESLLAIVDPAQLDETAPLPARTLARVEERLPRDNWEAMAVEPGTAVGEVHLWLASDDNRSIFFQRSLLARVRLTVPPRARPSMQGP
jgi:hypothetical protein